MGNALTKPKLTGSLRRAAIVEAAIELFSKFGFRGTTTKQLASAVGVTEPVLYQHFETKRVLYDAILESRMAESNLGVLEDLEKFSEAGDNRAYFTRLAHMILDWHVADPRYPRLIMFAHLEGSELAQLFYERQITVFYETVTGHVRRQVESAVFRPVDPYVAARSFAGMVAHHGLIFSILRPGDLAASREQIINTAVDLFLRGIMA